MAENKLTEIIEASLEQIKQVVDANTIIGMPITTAGGTTIIPVSKVMVGFASGGIDYLGKNMKNTAESTQRTGPLQTNFGGGGGTGVTVQPVGFLVVGPDGRVDLLNIGGSSPEADRLETIANFIEKSPELISKITSIFKKEKAKSDKHAHGDAENDKESETVAK